MDLVENPVPDKPTKRQIDPYVGTGKLGTVDVDDEITYEITYVNYKTDATDIVITDKLDIHVEFVKASDGGICTGATEKNEGGTVTWRLKNVPAGQKGSVTLTVRVLATALVSNGGPGRIENGGPNTTTKVGNDDVFVLELVENSVKEKPEEPHKREVAPYEGDGTLGTVKVGDEITYEITYKNYKKQAADVFITDQLDANVKFISASDDGICEGADSVTNGGGTVTWSIANVPAGQEGKVTLKVQVLEGALKSKNGPGKVVNGGETATVKVNGDDAYTLELVENPVEEPKEPEKPGRDTHTVVTGDETPIVPFAITMGISVVGIFVLIILMRRRKRHN